MATSTTFPSQAENPNGLYQRYNVTKVDGEEDPKAQYFVLRIDAFGDDPNHLEACQMAARVYAHQIKWHIPQLAADLHRLLDVNEAELHQRQREVPFVSMAHLGQSNKQDAQRVAWCQGDFRCGWDQPLQPNEEPPAQCPDCGGSVGVSGENQ